MNTIIIPCAGKSTRFPNMRPKWMLTHPDGSLMIEKSMSILDKNNFDRVIVSILREHVDKYEANIWLDQVFGSKIELCILENPTKSQTETIYKTITKMNVKGQFCVKDVDSCLSVKLKGKDNFVVGRDLRKSPEITNVSAKSFISLNEQNTVIDIVEKSVSSNYISVGLYGFISSDEFIKYYLELSKNVETELYPSHIIASMINSGSFVNYIECDKYLDWGTIDEWRNHVEQIKCCFVDIDGVVFKNKGNYGLKNWKTEDEPIIENIEALKRIQSDGGQLIFCTARPEEFRKKTEISLKSHGLVWHSIVMGCLHSKRFIINDFAPTNPYPSCNAINIQRNSSNLSDFI